MADEVTKLGVTGKIDVLVNESYSLFANVYRIWSCGRMTFDVQNAVPKIQDWAHAWGHIEVKIHKCMCFTQLTRITAHALITPKLSVRFQPWHCLGIMFTNRCWWFTLLQLEMPTNGVGTGRCDQLLRETPTYGGACCCCCLRLSTWVGARWCRSRREACGPPSSRSRMSSKHTWNGTTRFFTIGFFIV